MRGRNDGLCSCVFFRANETHASNMAITKKQWWLVRHKLVLKS